MSDDTAKPDPAFDVNACFSHDQEHRRLSESVRTLNKAAVFDSLDTAGIVSVVVIFNGYGDSGQIDAIEVTGETTELPSAAIEMASVVWGKSDVSRHIVPLQAAVEQMVYDFLDKTHFGWADNDGAYGEFVFDVDKRTITLDYNERYTSSENYSHEF